MPDDIRRIRDYRLTAVADAPDLRDWEYQPPLTALKKSMARPRGLEILDQGDEGACTGFALAAVINLLCKRARRSGLVSPRMLYEMARRHDEWRGYRYEGSSCRGAIKGFYNMGVCSAERWPYIDGDAGHLTIAAAKEAREVTLGAYYRLGTRISDFHAALNEAGVIYCSANVHEGWDAAFDGLEQIPLGDEQQGGHAFAIVGYTADGFWVQNSWGRDWGQNGLALWSYEDWRRNLTDAWVLNLGLSTPQIWHLPREGGSQAGRTAGLFRNTPTRAEIAGHFVHIDDGHFHDAGRYWSNPADVQETADLLARSAGYDHLLLFAHGGMTGIRDSARRIAAMKETFKVNRIYPYHFMYDTGFLEELKDVLQGSHAEATRRAGGIRQWLDRLIERLARRPGRALWREMKSGAESAFDEGAAGSETLAILLGALERRESPLQLHLVGHSAGSILLAHLLARLLAERPATRVASVNLLAPAISIAQFRTHYRPLLTARRPAGGIDRLDVYNLSAALERADSVAGVYAQSVLHLVSNSFEEDPLPVPLLGFEEHARRAGRRLQRFTQHVSEEGARGRPRTRARRHSDFDNDPATMNSVLTRVLGRRPGVPFTARTLAY